MKRKTPLRRTKWLRASATMPTRRRRTKYAARARDADYMAFVKTRSCATKMYAMPWLVAKSTPCRGPIEADHMGRRPVGRKAPDDTCAPLCQSHHRERTDHSGMFRLATKAELRAWMDSVVAETRALYASRSGHC